MRIVARAVVAWLAVAVAAAGCAPPSPGSVAMDDGTRSNAPKRIVTAIRGNPHTVYQKLNPRSNVAGITELEVLVNAPLCYFDDQGNLQPRLADAVPTLENGRWRLLADGTMETSWTIREGARWHDGVPLTADDLLFTLAVVQDRELPIFGDIAYASLDSAWAQDPRTIVVKWKQPYIQADRLFTYALALPMPKHLLEAAHTTEKATFTEHPYWAEEFVGTGAYRIRTWERGSHLVFAANESYLLGRPRIDEIVVRYIPDPATLAANILAGEVDVTMEGRLSIEWATTVRDQWRDGNVDFKTSSMLQIFPQFVSPTPSVVGSLEFRRAMLHAVNRQEMVDTLVFGLTSVGHTFVAPSEPEYRAVESSIVRYEYEPRRSIELLEGLGLRKGGDGTYRDGAGQRLTFEIRTSQGDDRQEKAMFATADDWQRLGVEVERTLVPPQRATDAEYRSTFPAFDLKGQAGTFDYAPSFHSSRVSLAENNYRVSGNNARYMNPHLDALIDRYYITIPPDERLRVAGQIVHYISDQVVWMGLYYSVTPLLVSNRLANVSQAKAARASTLSNVHEWDLR
jgi:peptide/nickel transport system substrate-binding protein